MTMERMPTGHMDRAPRSRRHTVPEGPTLFDDDTFFMQAAREIVQTTPREVVQVDPDDGRLDFSSLEEVTTGPIRIVDLPSSALEERFEELERRADELADKRGISIAQALEQLDTDGVVAERKKRVALERKRVEEQARREQIETNSIAIGQIREEENARRRALVATLYPEGSEKQRVALIEYDAKQRAAAEIKQRGY